MAFHKRCPLSGIVATLINSGAAFRNFVPYEAKWKQVEEGLALSPANCVGMRQAHIPFQPPPEV